MKSMAYNGNVSPPLETLPGMRRDPRSAHRMHTSTSTESEAGAQAFNLRQKYAELLIHY
ncbi:unnamed protein product [Ectocarpus sp. CCAP 1310/34]|nr:unnamed protein product [Ectocarpus sp. CCAP 1310/34]